MFGMGFTEILIIAVIAILFLGPDKLPGAMVDIAKFFRSTKNALGSMKESIEEEINIKDIKEEALAYKKELLVASDKFKTATNVNHMASKLTSLDDSLDDDILGDNDLRKEPPEKPQEQIKETTQKKPQEKPKETAEEMHKKLEAVTLKKKIRKEDDQNV